MKFKEAQELYQADTIREHGVLERHCEHGIGHPVSHLDDKILQTRWMWVHGCDGCCFYFLDAHPERQQKDG